MHASEDEKRYYIQGPMGKGLGLHRESRGLHIAFVGGTGVFPFLDLVAYLLRMVIARLNKGYKMFDDEEFDDLDEGF